MASVQNIGINEEKTKVNNEQTLHSSEMAKNVPPIPLGKTPTRESYWFAHSGHEDVPSNGVQSDPKAGGDAKNTQQEKDEKLRRLRNLELQEEERLRKLRDLENQFSQAKRHREQQEEERRRRIDEARVKEAERRLQVEERKRQIWEAEQERKEAILRRNMEREARIEARRNAQRNSQCFAFGSSTPRSFDLDLAAIGVRNQGSVLMCSVSRRSEERELGPPRATSACSLDRKFENVSYHDDLRYDRPNFFRASSLEPAPSRVSYQSKVIALQQNSAIDMKACLSMLDNNFYNRSNCYNSPSSGWLVGSGVTVGDDCMSRSMVSLSSSQNFRGRKRTDITPTLTRERSITPHSATARGNHPMRAISMTRLDQLAQPRRTFFQPPTTTTMSPSKSMCNLAKRTPPPRPNCDTPRSSMSRSMMHLPQAEHGRRTPPSRPMSRNCDTPRSSMSRSMMHLPQAERVHSEHGRRFSPSPTMPPAPSSGMRSARSMLQLAAPRLTRTARLRAEALGRAASAWNLSKAENAQPGLSVPSGKDTSRSPPRPHSSLSGTSDISATSSSMSAVQMRPRVAPRRPRPFSVAGSIVDSSTLTQSVRTEPERQPRLHERNVSAPAAKPQRAKSANRESSEFRNTRPLTAPKKPVLPPKPTELLAKAKSHPVPIKDNLRKMAKPITKPTTTEAKPSTDVKPTPDIHQNGIDKSECKKNEVAPQTEQNSMPATPKPSSTVASPTSDSEMQISSESSVVVEPETDTLSQSIVESESKEINSPVSKSSAVQKEIELNIPKEETSQISALKNGSTPSKLETKDDVPNLMTTSLVIEKRKESIPASMTTSLVIENGKEFMPSKPRITSEEEARAALAEKRRLAREQAEREAELERQRLEEIQRQEEEQRRQEELEQKRMEEEQIRLAELHRQLEQEKLNKAIEENQQREREEQEKRDEEARQKAEREEQEKKAREEAEKQRIELEEKLRKEEEERAERKRRVEQIMARTRGKSAAQSPSTPTENNKLAKTETPNTPSTPSEPLKADLAPTNHVSNGVKEHVNGTSTNNSWPFSEEKSQVTSSPLPDLLNSANLNGSYVAEEQSVSSFSSRTLSANEDVSPQTNGYSSHEEMSCTTSPEESADMGLLIDIQSCQQRTSKTFSETVDFTKLVEVEPPSLDNNVNNENYLISVDDVNSNLFNNSANPFAAFEDSIQQKKDTPVTDLLS